MKRQNQSQSRGNLPPRITTPNNPDFIQDYFSGGHHHHHQQPPFSPTKSVDNNMFNNMYFPNQMIPPNSANGFNTPLYNTAVDSLDNYDLRDTTNASNKQKWDMTRGLTTPTTPNQFSIPVPFRNGYDMYSADPQQPLMTPPPYMRGNGPNHFMNGGNEEMMNMNMNQVPSDQNSNLLSPIQPMENTGGAQNNKKANLYKTELCRSFEETGQCRYGVKCQFAHSESELRHVDRHPKYKTEMCKTFWEQGTCPYGKRCCFIHTSRDLSKKEETAATNSALAAANAMDKKNGNTNVNKKKEGAGSENSNNLSENSETIAINSEEGENTNNNRSRSGSDSATAASMTEEVLSTTTESEEKITEEVVKTSTSAAEEKKEDNASATSLKKNDNENATATTSKGMKASTALPINTKNNKVGNAATKGMASSFEPMARTPTTNQSFNYSTSFGGTMNMMNNNYVPRRKMSSPPQRQNQNQRISNNNNSKFLNNLTIDLNNLNNGNFNSMMGMNSLSYQPTSPLDNEFMFNNHDMNSKLMGGQNINGMSTSLPVNDLLDDKMMLKLQNLHLQTTPPHTPVNNQRANANQGMMSPLSSSFNQNNLFMKQPLAVNTQNSSGLFLKQAAANASPFTPGTPSSFLSPKQNHMTLPPIPLIDDENGSVKGPGSVSGKGSDYGDDTKSNATEETNTSSATSNNLFVKQAINTSKTNNQHSFLKISQPTTPKTPSYMPSTPQSISNNFLNSTNGTASPLVTGNRLGTSIPSTPVHPNSFNHAAIEDIFSNNTVVNDFSHIRGNNTTSNINVATSPFTPSNDLSQYMFQMSSSNSNTGLNSLENIKSPSQLFYMPSTNTITTMNGTPTAKANGGFGNLSMGGLGMVKNRSESFDYGMLSQNGLNGFLGSNNPASPVAAFNSMASSFNNSSFLNNKGRSESIDFGQMSTHRKDSNVVGSVPTLSFLQSINEGIPDSPFSNHGSPLPSTTTTLNDIGMDNLLGGGIGGGRRKSFPESSLMQPNRLPTVPEGRHPNIVEEEERLFNNNNLTDEGILKFSKEHFGLDDVHSKSLLGAHSGANSMDFKGSIFAPMSPTSNPNSFF